MTPEAAVYTFLSSFGIPAYAASSVPDQATFPYLTYDLVLGEWGQPEVNMPVNVWYRTDSEAIPNAKVREIGAAIPPRSKVPIPCDGGGILISRGSPWAQAVTVEGEDEKVKRRYVNINIEFLTSD